MWRIALPSSLFRVMSFGCVVVAQAFLGHNSEMGLAGYALLQRTFICFIYDVMVSTLCQYQFFSPVVFHQNQSVMLQCSRPWCFEITSDCKLYLSTTWMMTKLKENWYTIVKKENNKRGTRTTPIYNTNICYLFWL